MKIIKIFFVFIIAITMSFSITFGISEEIISSSNWEKWQDENYWEWHTRTTTDDKAYNGNHIKIANDSIHFYGYWENSYKDFLYKEYENSGEKLFQFAIDESKANYHTLDGAGIIFNSKINNNKISGYILLFTEKEICLYKIEDIDIEMFETQANKTIDNYGELLDRKLKTNSKIHNLIVIAGLKNIKVIEESSEIMNVELDYSKQIGNSFGLISSYKQHSCGVLSEIEFTQLKIKNYELSVLNTNNSGDYIEGSSFVVKDENGNVVKSGVTNKNGTFNITDIDEGVYTLEQVSVPSIYILNNNKYKFKVTSDRRIVDPTTEKEIELLVKNEKYKINVSCKTNSNKPVLGAKIGLYDSHANKIAEEITDSNGNVSFTDITEGNYTYKLLDLGNSSNKNNYIYNDTEYSCTLNKDGKVNFEKNDGVIYVEEKSYTENKQENIENPETKNNTNKNYDTTSKQKLPYAGFKNVTLKLSIFIILFISIIFLIKIYNYKNI